MPPNIEIEKRDEFYPTRCVQVVLKCISSNSVAEYIIVKTIENYSNYKI